MKSLNETIKTLNFDALDSEIMASTGKEEVTYKKDTVSQLVLENFQEECFSRQDAAGMVNNFVDFLKARLLEGTALIFTGHGRLIPRLKQGGRPVRDLSRSTSIEMKTTATITFSKTQKCQGEKISTRRIVKDFVQNLRQKCSLPLSIALRLKVVVWKFVVLVFSALLLLNHEKVVTQRLANQRIFLQLATLVFVSAPLSVRN